jgi:malate/lactate dehydrogenase
MRMYMTLVHEANVNPKVVHRVVGWEHVPTYVP